MPRRQRVAPASSPATNVALLHLIKAIVGDNTSEVSKLMELTPSLAKASLAVGATRRTARDFFFPDIKHYFYEGDTPLHAAAVAYRKEIAQKLLSNGAKVSFANRMGATPLHYAVDGTPGSCVWNPEAQAETIAFLIEKGTDPNALDKSGVAPLHRAVRQRCSAAVDSLLRKGASTRLKNKNGSTPLHLAVQNTGKSGSGSPQLKSLQLEIIDLLLKAGANPKELDGRGKTVLQCADKHCKAALDLKTEKK